MPAKWLFSILGVALKSASPVLVRNLREMVAEMVARAEATPNPWDDIIVGLLQMIVGKPGEKGSDGERGDG